MKAKKGSIKSLLRDLVFPMPVVSRSMQKGFTLMETLVAIAILLVAVVGPISLIGDALHKLYYARDEMIAINLAQEGIEAVRQARDSNKLAGAADWTTGLAASDYTVDMGQLSASQPVLSVCGAPLSCTPQPVYFDTPTGLYRQGTGSTLTQFSRIVTIRALTLGTFQRQVTSKVTWMTAGQAGTITVVENIFNWQI